MCPCRIIRQAGQMLMQISRDPFIMANGKINPNSLFCAWIVFHFFVSVLAKICWMRQKFDFKSSQFALTGQKFALKNQRIFLNCWIFSSIGSVFLCLSAVWIQSSAIFRNCQISPLGTIHQCLRFFGSFRYGVFCGSPLSLPSRAVARPRTTFHLRYCGNTSSKRLCGAQQAEAMRFPFFLLRPHPSGVVRFGAIHYRSTQSVVLDVNFSMLTTTYAIASTQRQAQNRFIEKFRVQFA